MIEMRQEPTVRAWIRVGRAGASRLGIPRESRSQEVPWHNQVLRRPRATARFLREKRSPLNSIPWGEPARRLRSIRRHWAGRRPAAAGHGVRERSQS
jgi:hypothetical protein